MMKHTKTYDPFSLVIVPFPFTDKMKTKRRPALVMSNQKHQKETGHVTLIMVTSAKHSAWESDHLIEQLQKSGLSSPSIVRQKIFTIDSRLIIERIGKLSVQDIKKVTQRTMANLAFS